ncbi:MAG: SOS response-associated peptidase [Rhodococcus sp.]|nr:SOS response-associated peptidase [Rhodococcus sp. (in: high G+C Gram-positive bacteria)]
MCGRYATVTDPAVLAAEIDALDETGDGSGAPDTHVPRYNVAPTMAVPVVATGRGVRRIRRMRWGLVPTWAPDISGPPLFNARSETAHEKPAFRESFESRRALIPMDGWFEWASRPDKFGRPVNQPYFLAPDEGRLYMAGVWSHWRHPETREGLFSCAILTTASVGELANVHERMPLIVPPERWGRWLDPAEPTGAELLEPAWDQLSRITVTPVSSRVNSVRNDGPQLLERQDITDAQPEPGEQFTLL